MEHFGRRVCGGASLYGIFAPGRVRRDSRRTLSIYRLVLVEQCFSRPRPRFEDISTCCGMDTLGSLPPAWIHSALSPSHQPPDPVYGVGASLYSSSSSNSSSSSTLWRGAACRPPGRCKQRPSTPHSQIQTDSRSKIEDEDEFEDLAKLRTKLLERVTKRLCLVFNRRGHILPVSYRWRRPPATDLRTPRAAQIQAGSVAQIQAGSLCYTIPKGEIFYPACRTLRAQAQDAGRDQHRERRSWSSGLFGHTDCQSECNCGISGRC